MILFFVSPTGQTPTGDTVAKVLRGWMKEQGDGKYNCTCRSGPNLNDPMGLLTEITKVGSDDWNVVLLMQGVGGAILTDETKIKVVEALGAAENSSRLSGEIIHSVVTV